MKNSGGILPFGFYEGSRSEYLAHFALSAFGPALPVVRQEDYGLDFICNLAQREGLMINISNTFGIQVKSTGSSFKYKGKQATAWLQSLEFPFLYCEVDKENTIIKVFSTWMINRYLSYMLNKEEANIPDEITFLPYDSNFSGCQNNIEKGNISLGNPILEFTIEEICNPDTRSYYSLILKEWLDFEVENYTNRRAGLTTTFGYVSWETNKCLQQSRREYYRTYMYSDFLIEKAKNVLYQASVICGLHLKGTKQSEELNVLKEYIQKYCTVQSNMMILDVNYSK